MRKRDYFILLIIGWFLFAVAAIFQGSPGYMDADYYFASAMHIAGKRNFQIPFLWNYLSDPTGLPQPAYLYWMPLSGLVSALGLLLFPQLGFEATQLAFIFISGFIPPLTAYLSYQWSGQRQIAIWAGGLAVFPCFYFPFLPTSDSFGLYMLGGLLWVLAAQRVVSSGEAITIGKYVLAAFSLGLIAGFMHLARADGWLWLLLGGAVIAGEGQVKRIPFKRPVMVMALAIGSVLVGYLIVLGPWLVRNWMDFGALMPPGGLRSLWLTEYNDLYRFPAQVLSFDRWLSSGLEQILAVRLETFGAHLQTILAVQGEIFLAPLVVWGAWKLRSKKILQYLGLGYLATLGIMTVFFPFAGARGGFFHSGAAFQPIIWALGAVGMEQFIQWGVKQRGWRARSAGAVFRIAGLVLAAILTLFLFQSKVIGSDWRNPLWDASYRSYQGVEAWLQNNDVATGEIVMVNNPPGYFLASQRPAIVIPEGEIETIHEVARQYLASYLILEANHPEGLASLYRQPTSRTGLEYIGTYRDIHIFRIENHE